MEYVCHETFYWTDRRQNNFPREIACVPVKTIYMCIERDCVPEVGAEGGMVMAAELL